MSALFGRRLRRGATTTAVAAAAIAALSASQAPGAIPTDPGGAQSAADANPPAGSTATGNSPYYTELPPLTTPDGPSTSIDLPAAIGTGPAEAGIPATVLAAYKQAEQALAESKPGCNLPWQLLAAIGKVESGQARGGRVDANGTTTSPILGPVLNGIGFANISDTDNGAYDGDSTHDRAVGPMQFIPSTWATWGQDANGDGRKDPNNIYDAALAAAEYLCHADRDLSVDADLRQAILSYNRSQEYLSTVLTWFEYYNKGTHEVPDGTGVLPVGTGPADPGPSPSPTPPPSPEAPKPPKPSDPATPGGDSGNPSTPGGGSTTPPPSTEPTTPPTTPAPKPVVERIEKTDTGTLTAVAGSQFTERTSVRAVDAAGEPVADVPVRFEIVGDTDARFVSGKSALTLSTGEDGTATAPPVEAGEQTGEFAIRASVDVKGVADVEYTASVTARQADGLTRTGDEELTAESGTAFEDRISVEATYKGEAASGVAATATMITAAGGSAPRADGPYFKDAAGNPLRELTDLETDADGVLLLPKIYADDTTGTFLLRIETEGGATLTVELKVTAPPAETP
ncbi:lytic transglycosylase domain-containing protein [Streptomyces sp. 35G-GA-8]|uniref:lytic transglycosylase domain-containing protein n=1 Tax=Streptomyces sp. 35G-GA-8 TaxID=2939434 RepID=UPI00201F4892|nr:lytic transglycosylase domain-containing protein [Streptomyces sp. 35G-GA-8]MCL7378706.1 lytic transglycosylase domain-containing protein [Streptomyces sp. 35G-GA-8]